MNSLYDKYGRAPTVSKVVHDFYSKLLKSSTLKSFFEGINLDGLINHQILLFSHILGGPQQYDLSKLKTAHAHLSITNKEFDEVAGILEETLEDCGVEEHDIQIIMNIVSSTRPEIIQN